MANIIVTGAFGALGSAVVAELAARGHQVAGVDMAPAPATPLSFGNVDLTDETTVEMTYASAVSQMGSLDALVNVAGGFVWEPIETGSIDSWERMYRTNLRSAVVSCRAAIPHLLISKGSIVNIGAAAAANAGMGMAPYAASKSGVRALTESLADEMKGRGVRVNAVLPTIIDTPTNRADMPDANTSAWVKPQSAARVIAFLISAEAGAITGASIPLSLAG